MQQKPVTFEVAKALKEAGYPQGNTDKCYLTADHNQFYKKGQIVDNTNGEWKLVTKNLADIPTYIEVWLWLWRIKNIKIENIHDFAIYIYGFEEEIQLEGCSDPEEAIAKAIDHLVENNLIK